MNKADLDRLIIVGDKVFIKPLTPNEKTDSGLIIPAGVQEKEKIQRGYVLKAGPGFPIPLPSESEDFWKDNKETVKYIPLQPKEGDLAIFLLGQAIEVLYKKEKYFVVSQNAILMLERDEALT